MSAWLVAEAERDPLSSFAKLDPEQMGVPDEDITASLDVSIHADTRKKAVKEHRAQYSPFDRMPTPELAARFMSTDYFVRIDPPITENESGITDHDLFEGLDIYRRTIRQIPPRNPLNHARLSSFERISARPATGDPSSALITSASSFPSHSATAPPKSQPSGDTPIAIT